MKRMRLILGGCFILLGIMTGCRPLFEEQENEVVQAVEEAIEKETIEEEAFYNIAFNQYAEDDVVALIINEPEKEVLKGFMHLETYTHHENTEEVLVIPKYNGSKIEVKKVSFDGEKIVEEEILYTKLSTENDYGLLIQTFRPEGIPNLMIRVTTGDKKVTYLITENGKDGGATPIYLNTNEENQSNKQLENEKVDEIAEIIYPIKSK